MPDYQFNKGRRAKNFNCEMMERLELKHLAPYLPYGLKVSVFNKAPIVMNASSSSSGNWVGIGAVIKWSENCKPILRPLSDLLNDEDSFDYIFIKETDYESIQEWIWLDTESQKTCKFSLDFWSELFKNHFDVFGLIDQGLAIDINTLNNK